MDSIRNNQFVKINNYFKELEDENLDTKRLKSLTNSIPEKVVLSKKVTEDIKEDIYFSSLEKLKSEASRSDTKLMSTFAIYAALTGNRFIDYGVDKIRKMASISEERLRKYLLEINKNPNENIINHFIETNINGNEDYFKYRDQEMRTENIKPYNFDKMLRASIFIPKKIIQICKDKEVKEIIRKDAFNRNIGVLFEGFSNIDYDILKAEESTFFEPCYSGMDNITGPWDAYYHIRREGVDKSEDKMQIFIKNVLDGMSKEIESGYKPIFDLDDYCEENPSKIERLSGFINDLDEDTSERLANDAGKSFKLDAYDRDMGKS